MLEVLLNVLAVIGIIVVGGFVVVFLGNLLLSVLDSSSKDKNTNDVQPQQYYQQMPEQITYHAPAPAPTYVEEPKYQVEEYSDVDMSKAAEEEALLAQRNSKLDDEYAKLREEQEALRQERLKFMEEKKKAEEEAEAAKAAEAAKTAEEAKVAEEPVEEDDIDLDDIFFDEDEELVEEPAEEPAEEVAEEPVEETEEVVEEEVAEEPAVSNEELEALKAQLEAQKAEIEEYKKKAEEAEKAAEEARAAEEAAKAAAVEQGEANLSLEEYEARLATLEERLKGNEKDLKAVKKEYLPLARVRNSLERDKKKLRRREALVAKQKVVLYGVNNVSDIDEEKAKKLSEDLDLLDGLKASVAHCEEVINENKDRLPILENTYNILTENNAALKSDIEETKAKIDELKGQNGDTDSTDAE